MTAPRDRKKLTGSQVGLARELLRRPETESRVARAREYYARFIGSRTPRKPSVGFESHHILPVCLGGTDDPSNLVYLTPKEHAHAHLVLWRAYPKSTSIVHAAVLMNFKEGRLLPSRTVALLRQANSWASRSIADDPDRYNFYREAQLKGMSRQEVRGKIAAGNLERWKDPEFRVRNHFGMLQSSDLRFYRRFRVWAEFLLSRNRQPRKLAGDPLERQLYRWTQNHKAQRPLILLVLSRIDSGDQWKEFLVATLVGLPEERNDTQRKRDGARDLQDRLFLAGLLPSKVGIRTKVLQLDNQILRWAKIAEENCIEIPQELRGREPNSPFGNLVGNLNQTPN